MKERLRRDKAKTHVLPISPLGLMEMTRQRAQESISRRGLRSLPLLHRPRQGEERHDHERRAAARPAPDMRRYPDTSTRLKVIVNPHVLTRLRSEDEELLVEIERKYAGRLTFRSDPAYHHEKFTILDALTNQELKP